MELRPDLPLITAPTFIIAGRDDPATPVGMMEEIAISIGHATLTIILHAAHLLAVEQPAATAELLKTSVAMVEETLKV
jgi:3-oxoadipate enol-lactonase / 4-carboxymuconolactone decarboxylase